MLILISNLFVNLHAQQTKPAFSPVANGYEGRKDLYKFIAKNTIYPKEAQEKGINEVVYAYVIIDEDGNLLNVELAFKHDFGFGEEAIRVINMVPKWIPIQIDGKNVRTKYLLFVKFPPDTTSINADSTDATLNSDTLLGRFYPIDLMKYYYPKEFSGYYFYLFLYADGNYRVELEKKSDYDVIFKGYTISIGRYEVKNDTILLTDSYTRCKMSFQLDSCLIPIKTYSFMKEIVYKNYYICGKMEKNNLVEIIAEKLASDFEAESTKNNPFTEGFYRYEFYRGERFEIKLDKDNKYEFCFKAFEESFLSSKLDLYLVISTGTWERQGNILTLWDTNLQHKFYGLIRKDGTIEFLFFRWTVDMIFKKI